MEFGALVCKPINPNCNECKINKICLYYKLESKIKFKKKIKVKPHDDMFPCMSCSVHSL